jgi:hypothetical protein
MDNNFYNILQTFKLLDEGMTKEAMWRDAERMTREQFCDKWGQEHAEFWDNIMGEMDEGSMADAEHHSTGPKFTGYWKGTDPRTPGTHMVGGAAESVEQECKEPMSLTDRLKARWAETKRAKGLDEGGAPNNPTQATTDPIKAKQLAQQTQQAGQAFQKLQNMAGIKVGVGASQAAKTAVANTQNPNINPATGAGMDTTGKKIVGALGKGIEDALVNANPTDQNKLIQDLQRMKMKPTGTV